MPNDPTDPDQMELRTIDSSFPSHLHRNTDKFRSLIADEAQLRQFQ
jgi:hypothetical protein